MKAIIFDMDGVIIDTEKIYYDMFLELFQDTDISEDVFHTLIGASDQLVDSVIEKYYRGTKEQAYEKMASIFHYKHFDFHQILNIEVRYLIRDLFQRGYRLALASSSQKKIIEKVLQDCELEEFFEFVISAEECTQSKPSPEIYQRVLDAMRLKPEDVLIVEDSSYGIEAAKAIGAVCVAKQEDRFPIDQSKADYIFKDLRNIKTILPPDKDIRRIPFKSKEHLKSLLLRGKIHQSVENEKNDLIYAAYEENRMVATFILTIQDDIFIKEYRTLDDEVRYLQKLLQHLWKRYHKTIRMAYDSRLLQLGFQKEQQEMVWGSNCESTNF